MRPCLFVQLDPLCLQPLVSFSTALKTRFAEPQMDPAVVVSRYKQVFDVTCSLPTCRECCGCVCAQSTDNSSGSH
jgi:hypothetical protein